MLKKIIFFFILALATGSMDAQIRVRKPNTKTKTSEDAKWTERIVFGGGVGIGYTNGWNISLTPQVGYKITERFWSGIGLEYYYVSFRGNNDFRDRFSVIGPKVWALYYITDELNLGTEFARYNFKRTQIVNSRRTEVRSEQNSWLVGGGYTQRFGGRAGVRLELYYDVLYDDNDPNQFRNSAFIPRINIVYGF